MSSKTIVLASSDGETFEISEAVAHKFQSIAHMIEDDCADESIPIKNVTGDILSKVIEYSKKHVEASDSIKEEDEVDRNNLKTWDEEFVKSMDLATIFKVINAANDLNFKSLIDFLCQKVADSINYMKPDEFRLIREMLNRQRDFFFEPIIKP